MPKWRFLVVRHFGGPHQRRHICAQIKQQVEQDGLSHILPLVKYELGRQREYYLGVAVDVDASVNGADGEEAARRVLTEAGVHAAANRQFSPVVEAEQVQGLLRGTLECESFTIPIAYEAEASNRPPSTDGLFAELDLDDLSTAVPDASETEKYRRLLHWCSAVGSGELDRIKYACQLLGISDEWGGAWSVLRRLVLLGHLEFDGGSTLRWSVIPPTLVTGADGQHQVLVGQRAPALVAAVREKHQVEERPQVGGPPRLQVASTNDGLCYRDGRHVNAVGCVSQQMTELLPDLADWSCRLPEWQERDFARFQTEQYDPHADAFREIAPFAGQPPAGLYRFVFDQGPQRVVTVAFFDDARGQWVCGDFYGLRFLARSRCRLCRTVYREDALQLVIPVSDRWPMPYERALVLASGSLPQRAQPEGGSPVLAYEGITSDLAARMCSLLGLEMEGAG